MRLVNTREAKRMPLARPSSSACEDTSITHGAVAGVEHAAEGVLQVDRLGGGALDRLLLAADDGLSPCRAGRSGCRARLEQVRA